MKSTVATLNLELSLLDLDFSSEHGTVVNYVDTYNGREHSCFNIVRYNINTWVEEWI